MEFILAISSSYLGLISWIALAALPFAIAALVRGIHARQKRPIVLGLAGLIGSAVGLTPLAVSVWRLGYYGL
jgi:hypothetical protein